MAALSVAFVMFTQFGPFAVAVAVTTSGDSRVYTLRTSGRQSRGKLNLIVSVVLLELNGRSGLVSYVWVFSCDVSGFAAREREIVAVKHVAGTGTWLSRAQCCACVMRSLDECRGPLRERREGVGYPHRRCR